MKKMKKFAALLVTALMVMTMGSVAFAQADTALTINTTSGHTYNVYQLLKGDVSNLNAGTGTLSNVTRGANLKTSKTVDEFTAAINGKSGVELSDIAFSYTAGTPVTVNGTGSAVSTTVANGYYVVEDTTDTTDTVSRYMVAVVGPTTMSPKATSKPTMEKKIKDINDSTDENFSSWQDSADHDIGDAVPFKLEATLPDSYSDYHNYYISFNDTLSQGLTLQASTIKVSVDGTQLEDSKYYIYGDQNSFQVVIYDLKTAVPAAQNSSKVTVEYSAILNNKAVLGETGNPNVANLTYSNNPNAETAVTPGEEDQPGTPDKPENPDTPDTPGNPDEPNTPDNPGQTPDDTVIVFTYKVTANKIKADQTALTGASFKLEKLDSAGNVIKDLGTIDGTQISTFEWKGIDDGIYKITETVTPPGYNSIAPQTFTVTAVHTNDGDENPLHLTALSGNPATGSVITIAGSKTDGSLTTNIVNQSGSILPTTGGMGTRLFYLVGSILVLGAGVLLFTRKRMAR